MAQARGRILWLVSIFLILAIAPIYYIYLTFRPPFQLYQSLTEQGHQESSKLIKSAPGKKYVKFKQLQGAGFNNQAQEILLFHHLALETNRVYVYQPLIWRPRGEKAEVPLSAFLLGPTQGSISEAVFDQVCPPGEVEHVRVLTNPNDQWDHAKRVLNKDTRCLMVDDWLFNWNYLASTGIHPIWPSFETYLATHFKWSPNVTLIFNRTLLDLGLRAKGTNPRNLHKPYVALHIRRGDFEDHCGSLARTGMGFTTWATLPNLQSAVFPPALNVTDPTSIMQHCFPSLWRVLDAVSQQVRHRPHLRTLYILHDGAWDHPTVYHAFYKLARAFTNEAWARKEGWQGGAMLRVLHPLNVRLGQGERDWAVCVDIELARHAEIFIGNGYSSLSTQIVALRLADSKGDNKDISFY